MQEKPEEAVQIAVVLARRFCIAILELPHQLAHAPAGCIQIGGQGAGGPADASLCRLCTCASWGASGITLSCSLLAHAIPRTCARWRLCINLNRVLVHVVVLIAVLTTRVGCDRYSVHVVDATMLLAA